MNALVARTRRAKSGQDVLRRGQHLLQSRLGRAGPLLPTRNLNGTFVSVNIARREHVASFHRRQRPVRSPGIVSLAELGQKDAACSTFKELKAKYPGAPVHIGDEAKAWRKKAGC